MVSRLENLPNEILLYIFSLIPCYDIIHSNISGLNIRLRSIIRDIDVDVRQLDRLSKDEFDGISMHLCPSNIFTLSLSNTSIPDQIKQFFSMIDIKKLYQLKSVTLNQPTELDLTKFLFKLLSLPRLMMLKIDTKSPTSVWKILTMQNFAPSQLNTTLSKLIIINSSSTELYMNYIDSTQHFFDLFFFYPSLKYLTIDFRLSVPVDNQSISFIGHQLKYLNLTSNNVPLIEAIMKYISNIQYLSCTARYAVRQEMLGSYWEHLLSPLNKLKTFNLYLSHALNDFNSDELMNEVHLSYETDFWLIYHQWYVNIQSYGGRTDIYTVPYPPTTLNVYFRDDYRTLTTVPYPQPTDFNNVKTLNLIIDSLASPPVQSLKYPNVTSLQILGQTSSYERPRHLQTFLNECVVFDNLLELILSDSCIMNRQFYLTLFEQSPNLSILNMFDYNQLVGLTNTFRHRSMCSILQKQMKKLILNDGYVDWNEKFLETFANLKILTCPYHSENELYLLVPKVLNIMTNLTLLQLKSTYRLSETFQENFRIWLTKNTPMTNTKNTIVRCHSNMITIWNGQGIDPILLSLPDD